MWVWRRPQSATAAPFKLDPHVVKFPDTQVGAASGRVVDVENTSDATIYIHVSLSGSSDITRAFQSVCALEPLPLEPGQGCNLGFQYAPSDEGSDTAVATFTEIVSGATKPVYLRGTGFIL